MSAKDKSAGKSRGFKRLLDNMDKTYVVRSNLRHYVPFADIKLLLIGSCIIFFASLYPAASFTCFLPSAILVCLFLACLPFISLNALVNYNTEKTGRKIAELVSVLNRWYSVREDIFYAFRKAAESGIGEPMASMFNDLSIRVNSGMDPSEALDLLKDRINHPGFTNLTINLKHSIRCRGDLKKLLNNMEFQSHKISEELTRRKISTFRDRLTTYCTMGGVLVIGYVSICFEPRVSYLYLSTTSGKILLFLFILLYAAGAVVAMKLLKSEY